MYCSIWFILSMHSSKFFEANMGMCAQHKECSICGQGSSTDLCKKRGLCNQISGVSEHYVFIDVITFVIKFGLERIIYHFAVIVYVI